jgi:hypothetical protein
MTKQKEDQNYLYKIYSDETENETNPDTDFRKNEEIEFDDASK